MGKLILRGLIIIFISAVILSSISNNFSKQHTEKQTMKTACTSCHLDMKAALESSDNYYHDAESLGVSTTEDACTYCHLTNFEEDGKSHNGQARNHESENAHITFTLGCLDCHEESGLTHNSKTVNIINDFNSSEIHSQNAFENNNIKSSRMREINEECMFCHTKMYKNEPIIMSNKEMNLTAYITKSTWMVTFSVYYP